MSRRSSATSSSSASSSSSSSSGSSSDSSSSDSEGSSVASTRGSSESEPEHFVNNKRGPKTSATSVPKSSPKKPVTKEKANLPVGKSQKSSVLSNKKSPKKLQDKEGKEKSKRLPSHYAGHSSESEKETRSSKMKNSIKSNVTPRKSHTKTHSVSQKIKSVKETPDPRRSSRKSNKTPEKSSETSTNSSSSSSGNDSDSSCDSSESTGEKDRTKSVSSETEKEEEEDKNERRLITRSSSVKTKRSSLLGINKAATDSEPENGNNNSGKNKRHRLGETKKCARSLTLREYDQNEIYGNESSKGRPVNKKKKVKNNMLEQVQLSPIEKRNCPVDGCDSSGHLGGLYTRHFTVEACPVFHNLTKEECKANREERLSDENERDLALALKDGKSPRPGLKNEQRNYCNKIRDSRDRMSEVKKGDEDLADSDRQPSLKGLTPDWDLKLFMQAQAAASEQTEDEMRGLPDTKGIRYIQMGHFEMEAWYQSQYPDDYNQQPKIYVCEFCLKYMRSKRILMRHADKCVWRHPPGDEIYRKDKLAVWEVDGIKYKTYCQNLCLLAMLFLDHKTLYYDVEPFLFYIMTIADAEGCHIVGYFSKEKNSFLNYNVSCIMTLPPYQRQGFGRLLIEFSYLLTKEEGKIGSPEKPLSDLGLISYRAYWKDLLLKYLYNYDGKNVSIKDISTNSAVNSYDLVSTLQAMGMMKYWKGKHILLKRQDLFEDYEERLSRRTGPHKEIDPSCLNWRPYVPPPPPEDSQSNSGNEKTSSNKKARNPESRSNSEVFSSLSIRSKRQYSQHLTNGE